MNTNIRSHSTAMSSAILMRSGAIKSRWIAYDAAPMGYVRLSYVAPAQSAALSFTYSNHDQANRAKDNGTENLT